VRPLGRPVRALGGPLRALGRVLAAGLPVRFVAALAALVLVLILYTVATTREEKGIRGYAEVTLFPRSCLVDPARQENVGSCQRVFPGVYVVRFTRSLEGSSIVVSRGACCPGRIAGSITQERVATLVIERRVRRPVRATVIAP
jgi:hypothetical protein